ncbi:sensor domain-containing diguanylate cyclase [Candidatus Uhrbacteria bacterium]|nr:sensor domain-containing diguanylate cyclase [Candidatus Uhrbacteria bacterium]
MTNTADDKIRDSRYPHQMPEQEGFDTPESFETALMRYYKGQAELTERFFEALPFAAISTLHDGTVVYANSPAQLLFGLTKADLARHKANDFLFDADGNSIGVEIGRRLTKGQIIRQEAVYVRASEGESSLRMLSVTPVFASGTQTLVRAIGFFMDPSACEHENVTLRTLNQELQTALVAKEDELERLRVEASSLRVQVDTDDLTGVMNKPAFSRNARMRIEEQRRKRGSAGLLFLDPDDFKLLNDTYGHDIGDELIQELASRGRLIAEKYGGLFARFGGDEFYALFTDLDATKFEMIVGEFAETMPFETEAENAKTRIREKFRVGVSFGGCFRTSGVIPDLRLLLKEADRAMYDCKESGKGIDRPKPYVVSFSHAQSSSKPPSP